MSTITRRIYRAIERFWMKNRVPIAIFVLLAIFLLIYAWNDIAVSIYSGQQGVLWNRFSGTVVDDSYDEGLHLIFPWNKMTIYNLRVQHTDDSITVLTVDGMAMSIDFSVIHRPLRPELGHIHRAVGPEYFENLIRPMVVSAIRQVIGSHRTEDIIAMPERRLLQLIDSNIYSHVFRYQYASAEAGAILESDTSMRVLPGDLDSGEQQIVPEDLINLFQIEVKIHTLVLPQKVQLAINEKLVHEQSEESYAFRLAREEKEKERKRIEAEGIRDFEAISGISMLQWRGVDATEQLAKSENAKIIIIGTDQKELPILLSGETKK